MRLTTVGPRVAPVGSRRHRSVQVLLRWSVQGRLRGRSKRGTGRSKDGTGRFKTASVGASFLTMAGARGARARDCFTHTRSGTSTTVRAAFLNSRARLHQG